MRTSVNLPDALLEAARERADRTGRTVTSLLEEGLRRVLAEPATPAVASLPTDGAPHGRLLVDVADSAALWEALDADGAGGPR